MAREYSVYNQGIASSSLTIGILTKNFFCWYQEFLCPVERLFDYVRKVEP